MQKLGCYLSQSLSKKATHSSHECSFLLTNVKTQASSIKMNAHNDKASMLGGTQNQVISQLITPRHGSFLEASLLLHFSKQPYNLGGSSLHDWYISPKNAPYTIPNFYICRPGLMYHYFSASRTSCLMMQRQWYTSIHKMWSG